MRLKKIEISGFKSFAHRTNLEFPVTISAIVGPNGSGKSNLVDAVRWVLGEQSFKSLRSKSGADLIWAGSSTKSAQGKASVDLHFSNRDGFFPIDFEDVVVGRKVYRDGTNEYYLNNSQVRLKDIAELLARSKLGLRGHTIVNQGSADELLKSSSEERKSILEEALGLREFQLKKSEAEAKLTETNNNLDKTSGLINEIFPHLRLLKRQVDKFKKKENLVNELSNLENQYFNFKIHEILSRINNNQIKREEFIKKISAARADFEAKEKIFEAKMISVYQTDEKTKQVEEILNKLNLERQNTTRELGRVEGLIESFRRSGNKNTKTLEAVLAIKIKYWVKRLNVIFGLDKISDIKETVKNLADEIQLIGNYLSRNETDQILNLAELSDFVEEESSPYEKDKNDLKIVLEKIEIKAKQARADIFKIREEENNWRSGYMAAQKDLELARREYLLAEEAKNAFDLEDEKIKLVETDLKSEMWGAGKNYDDALATFVSDSVQIETAYFKELESNIIKLRREVADIGSIDEEIIREHEETNKRHEFLSLELSDLNHACESLKNLINDLSGRISSDFITGMARINEEFNNYFRLMFGGGSAKLVVDGSGINVIGVNMNINIPQKRIKDLALLSGGERSLVSIALLFAIVSASQPPFLILDEVDAALDESNAARFAKVLKDLAKDTQFILITHNRATMEAAKVLYGVTMDADGVSKLLSLKLEEVIS